MERPLSLFPEEVWELILNNVMDSKDAWNLFRAFPELDTNPVLQKKKHIWLFGLVVPHLIPWRMDQWITEKSLLDCRPVCRHWSTAVDTYLEHHPNFTAYQKKEDQLGVFPWHPNTYVLKTDFDLRRLGTWKPSYFGGVAFDSDVKMLSKTLHDMEQHPPGRNPFLGRYLSVKFDAFAPDEGKDYWDDIITLHQRYGRHVWYYKFAFEITCLDPSRFVTQCLSQLSNLKSLHMTGMVMDDDSVVAVGPLVEAVRQDLSTFPQLESLRLEIDPDLDEIGHLLINRHSSQIRRLEMKLSLWKPEYWHSFPNLRELTVTEISKSMADIDGVKALLQNLEAPLLAKLQLSFDFMERERDRGSRVFGIEEDVFQWLKRFPNLRFFEFGEDCGVVRIQEMGTLEPSSDANHSLQFLSIRSSFGMTFNFLRCLPSLQYLTLYVPWKPVVIDHSVNPGGVKILEEIQTATIYKSNVWELLPKLKTVTLLVEDGDDGMIWASYLFNREEYEQHKRQMEMTEMSLTDSPCDEFAPLRKEMIDMLKEQKRLCYGDPDDPEDYDSDWMDT